MSDRTDKDLERGADEALERLAHGWHPLSTPESATATEPAARDAEAHVVAHLEAMALLAYAAAEQAPALEVRAAILHAVQAEPRAPRALPSAAAVSMSTPDPVDLTLRHSYTDDPGDQTLVGLGTGSDSAVHSPGASRDDLQPSRQPRDFHDLGAPPMHHQFRAPRRSARSSVPLYLLAAGLVFSLVGLGYLYGQLQEQNSKSITRQAQIEAQMQQTRAEADAMRARVQMVTDVARLAYPMQQVADGPGAARRVGRPEPGEARPDGIVYVCGQHQRWYLALSGFEPPPTGKVYHLWFKTERGLVDAGAIELDAQGRADVSRPSMPDSTRGFLVSLEDSAPSSVGEPHGRIILRGEQPVRL